MAIPNHTTGLAEIAARLAGDLVSTYAKSVWREYAPEGELPSSTEKPVVIINSVIDMTDTTFGENVGRLDITVYVVRHALAPASEADTVVSRVVGDGSTYGIDRWTPTITGIGTTPIRHTGGDGGGNDTNHAVHELRFETWLTEG